MKKIFFLTLFFLTGIFSVFFALPAKAITAGTFSGTCGADSHSPCQCISGLNNTYGVECVLPYSWSKTNLGASGCVLETNVPTDTTSTTYTTLACNTNVWNFTCKTGYSNCGGTCQADKTSPNGNCTTWDKCSGTCTACSNTTACTWPATWSNASCSCVAGTAYILKLGSDSTANGVTGTNVIQSGSQAALFINAFSVGINDSNPIGNALSVVGNIAGSNSLKISSSTAANWISGNLGLGNASEGASKLSIFGNQSIGVNYFNDAAPANGLIVQGNVGIGTNGPGDDLDIYSEFDHQLTIRKNGGSSLSLHAGGSPAIVWKDNADLLFGTKTSDNGINNFSSQMQLSVSGTLTMNGNVISNGTANNSFQGNVGIGTTQPNTKLQVESPLGAVAFFKSTINAGNYSGYIGNGQTFSGEEFGLYYALNDTRLAVYDLSKSLLLYGNGIAIDNNTNYVGIGTTSPTAALDILSNVKITAGGNIYNTDNSRYLDMTGILSDSLKISGNVYTTAGLFKSDGAGTNYMLGNLGIGTTSASVKLQISGGANQVINVGGGRIGGLANPQSSDEAVPLSYLSANYLSTSTSIGVASISLTTTTYNGSLTYAGGYTGYDAGNKICNAYSTGSHFCRTDEIIYLIQRNGATGFSTINGDNSWMADGPPGFTGAVSADDCGGYTDGTNSKLGHFWMFNSAGGGRGSLSSCDTIKKIACCK
jgi:hypothetical protein